MRVIFIFVQAKIKRLEKTNTPLSLSDITHHYGQRQVLSEITTSLPKDQVTAILGKSGSGKSTLLKIMNGQIAPHQGSVIAFGQPVDYQKMERLRQKIGYVVQQVGLFPHLNIRRNISLLGKIVHQTPQAIQDRVLQLLELVQLPLRYLTKYPYELSGGEQQRVGICRAMFLDPPVLLMDEPFGSLDYETKRFIYQNLLTIQMNQPRTVVLVTHDWDEAITLADRFLWIEEGKIKAEGSKSSLVDLKASIFS